MSKRKLEVNPAAQVAGGKCPVGDTFDREPPGPAFSPRGSHPNVVVKPVACPACHRPWVKAPEGRNVLRSTVLPDTPLHVAGRIYPGRVRRLVECECRQRFYVNEPLEGKK